MATIIPQPLGKSKAGLHTVKIDMTPMVDLGFLLITFFIFTTSITQPTITKLNMPKADPGGITNIYEKTLVTAILDKEKIIVYEGDFQKALAQNRLLQTNYDVKSGLGKFIRQKQKALQAINRKDELMVVLKPLPSASYQDVINALDEMTINRVLRYGIVDVSANEKSYLSSKQYGQRP